MSTGNWPHSLEKIFDRPGLLLLALVAMAFGPLLQHANRLRRRRWRSWCHNPHEHHISDDPKSNIIYFSLICLSWMLLSVALAGPRWGMGAERGVARGRDLVLVLDFSRSMLAADMADPSAPMRWQAAARAARTIVDACNRQGGDRLALVLFAARPTAIAPLTLDYDFLREMLAELDARHPPADIRPDQDTIPSGTRIGAALEEAVQLLDPRFRGMQDIILLTDADDPAGDGEWQAGVSAARAAGIPVHVIGIGNSEHAALVEFHGKPLLDPLGMPVRSRQDAATAQAIARAGQGDYLPAGTNMLNLEAWHAVRIRHAPQRDLIGGGRDHRDRSGWFYAAAALCSLLACTLPLRMEQ